MQLERVYTDRLRFLTQVAKGGFICTIYMLSKFTDEKKRRHKAVSACFDEGWRYTFGSATCSRCGHSSTDCGYSTFNQTGEARIVQGAFNAIAYRRGSGRSSSQIKLRNKKKEGIFERDGRTIMDGGDTRTWSAPSTFGGKCFAPLYMSSTDYLLPHAILDSDTPYHMIFGEHAL